MEETIKIFVYGTLKSGNSTRGLDSPQFADVEKTKLGIAKTTSSKFNMVDLGAFPGVVVNGTHDIQAKFGKAAKTF